MTKFCFLIYYTISIYKLKYNIKRKRKKSLENKKRMKTNVYLVQTFSNA